VKIGGNVIDDDSVLNRFIESFSAISGPKILIHGGGKLATQYSKRLGIETKLIDGRRITDDDTIQIVVMTYAGWINKRIVALLQSKSCNALGITGADAELIPAIKRPITDIDYGWVGDVLTEKINISFLTNLLEQNISPVIAPVTCNAEGQLLNVNADTIAQAVAESLAKYFSVSLIYCFEMNGVLNNVNDPSSVIDEIKSDEVNRLKNEGIISGGMIPKIDNAVNAILQGVNKVVIGNSDFIIQMANGQKGYGTIISK
jgi:acetylglutamate kinase